MIELVYWVAVLGAAVWVTVDATNLGAGKQRPGGLANTSPAAWFLVVFLIWIVGLPCYLVVRPKLVAGHRQAQGAGAFGTPAAYPSGGPGPRVPAPFGGPQPQHAYPVPMQPAASLTALPPWEAARVPGPPPGAHLSPDGYWWWDGGRWQPTVP